jgi:hypothetical protein
MPSDVAAKREVPDMLFDSSLKENIRVPRFGWRIPCQLPEAYETDVEREMVNDLKKELGRRDSQRRDSATQVAACVSDFVIF